MINKLPLLKESPSQTAGPYVHIGLTPNFAEINGVYDVDAGAQMLTPDTKGERIVVTGRIFDGSGAVLSDAIVEIWQADADGNFVSPQTPNSNTSPSFIGWGRKATDANGAFRFETVKPGVVPGPGGKDQAPHISLWIVARGINIGLQTRLYFEDEQEANAADPVLNRIMDVRRRKTLIASRSDDGATYTLDIHLQGDDETVFFDI
jgi:protocatechuate 3,4-dioxygenase alpha subunit